MIRGLLDSEGVIFTSTMIRPVKPLNSDTVGYKERNDKHGRHESGEPLTRDISHFYNRKTAGETPPFSYPL
jgi:hypothetical protein